MTSVWPLQLWPMKRRLKDDLKNQNRIMGKVYGGYGDEKKLIGKTV